MKFVHLAGFITNKFVTMQHGHMNLKFSLNICFRQNILKVVMYNRVYVHHSVLVTLYDVIECLSCSALGIISVK